MKKYRVILETNVLVSANNEEHAMEVAHKEICEEKPSEVGFIAWEDDGVTLTTSADIFS